MDTFLRVEIIAVSNGYTIRLGDDNHVSAVFENLESVIIYVNNYFKRKI